MLTSTTWNDWSCAVDVTTEDSGLMIAAAAVRAVMDDVSRAVNRFRADSDLSRINAGAGRFVRVSPLTIDLIDVACEVARWTNGCVDPMVGADLVAAGYDADIDVVRARTAVLPCRPSRVRSTWEAIRIDRTLNRVGIPAGTMVDLGASAKAWAAQEAAARAASLTGAPVLVGIGGDLAMCREPADGWRVDVAELRGAAVEALIVSEGAMATSSTIGRRFRGPDGTERHHLIDPRTGAAARSRWRTASVWAPSTVTANALSTWALIDADAAVAAVQSQGLAARFVSHDGVVSYAGTWAPPSTEVA
jgi:thiamine biosynthesis lipoprotein